MARELIGFFENPAEAARVRDEAIAAGFDADCVKVFEPTKKGEEPGFWDNVKDFFGIADEDDRKLYGEASRHGATAVAVDADNQSEEDRAIEIMQRHRPIDLDYQAQQWGMNTASSTSSQTQNQRPAQPRATESQATRQGEQAIPIVEEQLQVGKRQVAKGGVRIHTITKEKPVQQQVELREEEVNVQRRPADRPLTSTDQPFQNRTVEVTATSEEAVVAKTPRVVEEVVVDKQVKQQTKTVKDTVRRTDVEIEQLDATGEQLADTYAATLVHDQRFVGRDWDAIEPDVQRDFESKYPRNRWEQFRNAVRQRWTTLRSSL